MRPVPHVYKPTRSTFTDHLNDLFYTAGKIGELPPYWGTCLLVVSGLLWAGIYVVGSAIA